MKFFRGLIIGLPISLLLWMLFLWPLHAQQQQSPEIRALLTRLNDQSNQCNQYAVAAFQLQDKLAAAEAEVKALKDKYEPKKDN